MTTFGSRVTQRGRQFEVRVLYFNQGWGAGAGRSRVFLAPWSRSRFKKNPGAGAGFFFYLTSLRGKEYFAKLSQYSGAGAGFFWHLGAAAARKKIPGTGAAWGKNQEPEPLEKKVRSWSR